MKKILKSAATLGLLTGILAVSSWGQYSSGWSSGSTSGTCGSGSSSWGGFGGRLQVVGLTSDQRLICFSEDSPENASTIGFVTGFIAPDSRMIGMDYRPANSRLYGLGNAGGIYTIDPANGRATLVSRLTVALSGTSFGVDFNPVVDRMRIISNTGQNLRANVDNGVTAVDGTLTYTVPPATPATPALGVTGAAYTNNDSDPNTVTTLYDIDSNLDQVVIQSPANSGILSATGKLTVDTNDSIGFDIYSTIRNGTTVNVQGLASLTVGGRVGLYSITLFSGKANSRGLFRSTDQVLDIAIPLNQL